MAKRIPFNVIFTSDEDLNHPASELNNHGPTTHGWRSNATCSLTPKDIILRFQPARISRIQVLAHQYLIPERIELWIHFSPKAAPTTPSSQSFEYLGFISLSDNASTQYQSRELQSVSVPPKVGTHLKIRLGQAHENEFNQHGQVALLAINVLGEELTDDELANLNSSSSTLLNSSTNFDHLETIVSICDDLSFSMYVEESVAYIVREMEERKLKAVNDERFEYARKLKLCMNALRSAGERLGRYALAKRQAVQQEDFSTARLRKEQIEIYKKTIYEQLQIDDLLEKDGVNGSNDLCSELYASKPTLPSPPSLQDVADILARDILPMRMSVDNISLPASMSNDNHTADHVDQPKTTDSLMAGTDNLSDKPPSSPQLSKIGRSPNRGSPTTSTGSLRRRNKSVPRNTYEDYDERAIPTLRHSHTNEFLRECQGSALIEGESTARGRSKMNDREKRQAALPILVFGMDLVEQFYSRQFQDREDGLAGLRTILKGESSIAHSAGSNKIARGATLLLHRGIRDVVFSVFTQAAETVRCLFTEFVPGRVSLNEVSRCTDRLLPELLAKSGDPSARVHTLAQHTILSIAACPEVREQHLVAPALSRPVGNSTHPRLALSRIQMLEQLVLSQGICAEKQSGLSPRALSECGCSGIHHPAESVRKVAERVLLLVYKVNPRLVRKQLPPDDDITRRNLLYRQLFTEFDKIDFQRKREMLENANKQKINNHLFAQLSPPLTNSSSKSSPPMEPKNKANTVSFAFTEPKTMESLFNSLKLGERTSSPSPSRPVDLKIMKSKSGTSIVQHMTDYVKNNGNATYYEAEHGLNGKSEEKLGINLTQHKTLMFDSFIGFLGDGNVGGSRKSSNSNSDSLEAADREIRCPFCDWTCQGDSDQLDIHYWKVCPFLTKCPQCTTVLEVSALNNHLVDECEAKSSYVTCERCTESVHKQLYEYHLMEDFCRELTTGAQRCPLCHDDVNLPLDGGWKRHLGICVGNARRRTKK